MNSPVYDEFLVLNHDIDNDIKTTTQSDNTGWGWLVSSPSTWTFSTAQLGSNTSKYRNDSRNPTYSNSSSPSKASSVSSSALTLQHQVSISSFSTNPGLMDDFGDPFNYWTGSDISLIDDDLQQEQDYQQPYGERWDSWYPPTSQCSIHSTARLSSVVPDSKLSTWNRNYGSANLSDLDVSRSPSFLKPSEITKSRSQNPSRRPSTQAPYTTLPTVTIPPLPPQKPTFVSQLPRRPHKSWPMGPKPSRPSRARANTTPPSFKANRPSNLSTCTTLDDHVSPTSSTSSSPLYMRSPPPSPYEPPELTAFISQKSYFFFDDDDDTIEEDWLNAQKRKFLALMGGGLSTPDDASPSLAEPPRMVAKPKKRKKVSLEKGWNRLFGGGKRKSTEPEKEEVDTTRTEESRHKTCPKCSRVLKMHPSAGGRDGMMVTCGCRADLCFGCLKDWDYCYGICRSGA